jgi:hypothetical protein
MNFEETTPRSGFLEPPRTPESPIRSKSNGCLAGGGPVTAAVLPSRGDHADRASSVYRPADRHRDSDCLIDFDIVRSGDDMPKMTNVVVSDDFNKITFTEGDQWRHELTLVNKYKATHVWRLGVNVPNGDRRRSMMPRIPGFQASSADRNCGDSQAAQQFSPG